MGCKYISGWEVSIEKIKSTTKERVVSPKSTGGLDPPLGCTTGAMPALHVLVGAPASGRQQGPAAERSEVSSLGSLRNLIGSSYISSLNI